MSINKKIAAFIFISVFLAIIFAVPILTILNPREVHSAVEFRDLAQMPDFSWEAVHNGDFFDGIAEFLKDNVFGRNALLRAYTHFNANVMRVPVVNEIIITSTHLLHFEEHVFPDFSNADAVVDKAVALNEIVQSYGGVFLQANVPGQISGLRHLYPPHFYNRSTLFDFNVEVLIPNMRARGVDVISLYDVLLETYGDITHFFFATDHHFNFHGAFAVYRAIMNHLADNHDERLRPFGREDFTFIDLPNPFSGSRNRRVNYLWPKDMDVITIAYPNNPIYFHRYHMEDWGDWRVVRDDRKFFMPETDYCVVNFGMYNGGDWPELIFKTFRPELPNLLFFGDSHTNPVETLLYLHFNEMRILDMRNFRDMTLVEYILLHQPCFVVYLADDSKTLGWCGNEDFFGDNR